MKKTFILLLFLASAGYAQIPVSIPSFTKGLYTVDTFYTVETNSAPLCVSGVGSVYFGGEMALGFIDGIKFKMVIDKVEFGQSPSNPASWDEAGSMEVGDTMEVPVSFKVMAGSIDFHIIVEGIPEIAHESYLCDLAVAFTLSDDFGMAIVPISETTCSVLFTAEESEATKSSAQTIAAPNPFSDATTISFENSSGAGSEFFLFDSVGNQVRTISGITTNHLRIEKENLPCGIYHYQLRSNDEAVTSGSLVVE